MTHKSKDCVERPRAKGAKLTGKHIAPDEKIEQFDLDWEGKHDRYNGYDPTEYAKARTDPRLTASRAAAVRQKPRKRCGR